jgi:hypothetical protein
MSWLLPTKHEDKTPVQSAQDTELRKELRMAREDKTKAVKRQRDAGIGVTMQAIEQREAIEELLDRMERRRRSKKP